MNKITTLRICPPKQLFQLLFISRTSVFARSLIQKHGRQIAGIAAKEKTCVPCSRDRNRYISKLKSTPFEKQGKTFRNKSIQLIKIHSAEASH